MATRVRRRRRKPHHPIWHKIAIPLGALAALVAVAGGIAAAWAINIYNSAPPLSSLKPVQKGRSSAIYAADGSLIGFIRSENVRQPICRRSRCRRSLKDATVAIEDKNFYEHGALDHEGIARAAWKDLQAGAAGPGRLDDHPAAGPQPLHPQPGRHDRAKAERSHARGRTRGRAQQATGSSRHTSTPRPTGRSKGRPRSGAEAAAQTYFGKPAKELNLTEAALIAGLPQAPSEYNPFLDPKAALKRRNEVLAGDGRTGLHHRRGIPRGAHQRPRPQPRQQVPGDPRPVPLRPGPATN